MSEKCTIEISPNGLNNYQLRVKGPATLPAAGLILQRGALGISDADLDRMRTGEPPPALPNSVAHSLNTWLYGADLNLDIILGLADVQNQTPRRIVFDLTAISQPADLLRFADVPFELLETRSSGSPLALEPKVSSIVHVLPKVTSPVLTMENQNWPLSILIVRANPSDLGGAVPPAEPIAEMIKELADVNGWPSSSVDITILSSESPQYLSPTRANFFKTVNRSYDILVFIGHGDTVIDIGTNLPIGQLQLEASDGISSDPIDSKRLSILLNNHSIPVVLLIGCMTAATAADNSWFDRQNDTPPWIRGSTGVAQALVNGGCSVQFAVGMRYRITDDEAKDFLTGFFTSLLKTEPGNLELAVRAGRQSMLASPRNFPSWSAPMVMRTDMPEPFFPFLLAAPARPVVNEETLTMRNSFWQGLAGMRPDAGGFQIFLKFLDDIESKMLNSIQPVLQPQRVVVQPGTEEVEIPFEIQGNLTAKWLSGKISLSGANAELVGARTPAGFPMNLQTGVDGDRMFLFTLGGPADELKNIPTGVIFTMKVKLPLQPNMVVPISIERLDVNPNTALNTVPNAVLVSAI